MTVVIEIRNDSNTLQIDGVSQHMVLLRKGTMTTSALANSRTTVPITVANVTQNNGEILAIASPGGYSIAGRYNGTTTVFFYNTPGGTAIPYWVFGPYTPSSDTAGIFFRDANNTPLWDSGRPPMRPIGDVAGLGSFTVGSAGRVYALSTQTQFANLIRTEQVVGGTGPGGQVFLIQELVLGYAAINGQSVTIANNSTLADVAGPWNPQQAPINWNQSSASNNQQNAYSVFDVTNY